MSVRTELSIGDLLQGEAGQRHEGRLLRVAKALWPRWLVRKLLAGHGLIMLVTADK